MPQARLHLREIYCVIHSVGNWSSDTRVRLSRQALLDLQWWADLREELTSKPIQPPTSRVSLVTDASDIAWAGVLQSPESPEPQSTFGYFHDQLRGAHITLKELTAVRFTVQSFSHHLRSKVIQLHTDNTATRGAICKWTSKSAPMMAELRRLQLVLDELDSLLLAPIYVKSAENIADQYTRLHDHQDWQLDPELFQYFDDIWGPHSIDGFATANNCQLPRFIAGRPQPGALAVDCLAQPAHFWQHEVGWFNPPWEMLMDFIRYATAMQIRGTLVAPFWPAQPWFVSLMAITTAFEILEPHTSNFRPGCLANAVGYKSQLWKTIVCKIGH